MGCGLGDLLGYQSADTGHCGVSPVVQSLCTRSNILYWGRVVNRLCTSCPHGGSRGHRTPKPPCGCQARGVGGLAERSAMQLVLQLTRVAALEHEGSYYGRALSENLIPSILCLSGQDSG